MVDTNPQQKTQVTHEVIQSSAASLHTIRCKLLGFAQLLLNQAEMDIVPKQYNEGSYGLGLMLEQLSDEVREIGDDMDALIESKGN